MYGTQGVVSLPDLLQHKVKLSAASSNSTTRNTYFLWSSTEQYIGWKGKEIMYFNSSMYTYKKLTLATHVDTNITPCYHITDL